MKVLSFDIGIKNLAYCLLNDAKISEWQILNITDEKTDFTSTSKSLIQTLHDVFPDPEYDVVLIENQPLINPIMKSIQMIVYSYFQIQAFQHGSSCEVKLVAASNKLKVKHALKQSVYATKSKYKENKLRSIDYAKHYLQNTPEHSERLADFEACSKKDDLADCFLCAVHYLETQHKIAFF